MPKAKSILLEEVIRGVHAAEIGHVSALRCVHALAKGYEFRDLAGRLVDWKLMGVWLQPGRGFLTSAKYGRRPIFLHKIGDPVPGLLAGWETTQHPEEHDYWLDLLKRFDPDFS